LGFFSPFRSPVKPTTVSTPETNRPFWPIRRLPLVSSPDDGGRTFPEELRATCRGSLRLPDRYATLHHPCRRGVPQRVRGDLADATREFHSALEPAFHGFDRLSVEFHEADVVSAVKYAV